MKRSLLGSALVLALLMTLAGGAAQPAEAGDWFVGGSFRVGGLHFALAYDRHHGHHHPDYYYRTKAKIRYQGYRCGSACFKRSGYSYHHAGCPLVLQHFRHHRFHPAWVWDSLRAPGHDRYYGRHHDRGGYYGHRDYGYHGRGHRDYDRRDHRYRYDDREYHRGHDSRSCPYR